MTRDSLENVIRQALYSVAPDAEGEPIDSAAPLRDQLDIDSMDFLNFLVALRDALGVEVPEADYAQVASLDGCIRYLEKKLARS